jgi:hypothetical protein
VAREEKNKKISKKDNETEVLSKSQTAEEVQKIFDNWKNIMMLKRKRKEKTKKFGK